MEICVVGAGYVGLVSAVGFASRGHNVVCVDIDQERVEKINKGIPPFHDDGLEDALVDCVQTKGCLRAHSEYQQLAPSDISFICVGTSVGSHDMIDFAPMENSAKCLGEILRERDEFQLVVIRSTMTPGKTEDIVLPILEKYSGKSVGEGFGLAVNPEFLQEGMALTSFLKPNRVIIGQYDQRSGDILEQAYSGYSCPIVRTDLRTAEMIKLASNAFLAMKISFANEIGNLCKKLEIDTYDVVDGMGLDPRIGREFLNAGVGFGGSCLPKDLKALVGRLEEADIDPLITTAVSQVNKEQPLKIVDIMQKRMGCLEGKRVAVLGLAFKPGVDDVRHSPALQIVNELVHLGAIVKVYDPMAMSIAAPMLPKGTRYGVNTAETIDDSDCVMITTEWDEFKDERLYKDKTVVDGRRALDPSRASQICAHYEGVCW
ncbi:MAG: UDP-glucose/GDP-mannose dehydrogenase family protein [Chloroflexota bacterium]|nr:UDP-glucose/GDP-mannose dehydrogenase family protein [Chloroflexota bacterium]